jgi:hypothetical protein
MALFRFRFTVYISLTLNYTLMAPTRFIAVLAGLALSVSVFAGEDLPPAFHRNEIKFSGLSPALHYEHFFTRRISTDVGAGYSLYNYYPFSYEPLQREVTKLTISGRLYFADHQGTQFYWGVYNSFCHQWLHYPYSGANTYYYYNTIAGGLHLASGSAGLELGYKLPVRERLRVESNIGLSYNYYYKTYRTNNFSSATQGPLVSYGYAISFQMPVDLKMWVSLNYLIGSPK